MMGGLATIGSRDVEDFVTEFQRLPTGWFAAGGIVLLVAICWAIVWMYRSEGRIGSTPRTRLLLGITRCATIVLLAAILLEPALVRILRRWVDSYTIVLVDNSASMGMVDAYRQPEEAKLVQDVLARSDKNESSRIDLVHSVLERDDRAFLRALIKRNRVKLYSFAAESTLLATLATDRENLKAPDESEGATNVSSVESVTTEFVASGASTRIERAVRRSVESLGGAPIAGIVVLSDGGFNEGASPADVARYARERGIPIHVVGIGDPAEPRNVRIAEVIAPDNVFEKDPFSISAELTSQGLVGETIQIQLRERRADSMSEGQVVDTSTASVGLGGVVSEVSFERQKEQAGRFTYTVEVVGVENESVIDDNSRQTTVNVMDAQTRVLLVAGGPSWDYRYLSRLLERDETIDVSCWLQSAHLSAVRDGNTVIDHFPSLPDELAEYDVIILMDPDRSDFDDEWCRLIDKLVTQQGAGMLFAAARPRTPVFMRDPSLNVLHDLLPVTLDPEADLVLNQIGHYQQKSWPVELGVGAESHPIMQRGVDAVETRLAWQGLGDIYWHYPVLREKAVATVLMRHGNPRMRNSFGGQVLAAVQYVGAGRTGFLGLDGTWRWRRYGEEVFDRFWIQTIRFLAEGKLLGGMKRGLLMTDSTQASLGESVAVTARLLDERFEPIVRDQIVAVYEMDGVRRDFALTARRDRPGWYEGRFIPDRIGSCRIRMTLPASSGVEAEEFIRDIRIARSSLETLRPQMDRSALQALAVGSANGKYFGIDKADEIPKLIQDLHEELPIRSRPIPLWDNWKLFTLLLVLLSMEWFLRKWNRLL